MLAEGQQESLRRLAVSGAHRTHSAGEKTTDDGFIHHAFPIVEGHHHTQLSVVFQQSPCGLHQFGAEVLCLSGVSGRDGALRGLVSGRSLTLLI